MNKTILINKALEALEKLEEKTKPQTGLQSSEIRWTQHAQHERVQKAIELIKTVRKVSEDKK